MADGSSIERWLSLVPADESEIIGSAIAWFLNKQDPDRVRMEQYDNGYAIKIFTSRENVEEAQSFWAEYVQPKLTEE